MYINKAFKNIFRWFFWPPATLQGFTSESCKTRVRIAYSSLLFPFPGPSPTKRFRAVFFYSEMGISFSSGVFITVLFSVFFYLNAFFFFSHSQVCSKQIARNPSAERFLFVSELARRREHKKIEQLKNHLAGQSPLDIFLKLFDDEVQDIVLRFFVK